MHRLRTWAWLAVWMALPEKYATRMLFRAIKET